jgi:hypothetical protein
MHTPQLNMRRKLYALPIASVIVLTIFVCFIPSQVAQSQDEIEVQCGQIRENEFTDNIQEHVYLLNMNPNESFKVSVPTFRREKWVEKAITAIGKRGGKEGVSVCLENGIQRL